MNLKQKQESILKGNMYKTIFVLSVPIIINNLIQTLYSLVDGLWVGRIGATEFASVSFVWPINFLFIAIGMGLSIAGTSLLSQLLGAGENEKADKYASQLIVLSLITGVILGIVGIVFCKYLIMAMGGKDDILHFGTIYLQYAFLDLPFMFFFYIFNSIMNSQGNTTVPTALSGISAVMNMILDPIFIFTLDLGVGGAAIATVISRGALALFGAIVLFRGKTGIHPKFKNFKFNKEIIKNTLRIAIPSSIGQSGSSIGFMVLNSFIVSYGTATMAAFGMVNRVFDLVTNPAMGMGTALVSIVGQNIGAGNINRAKEGFKKTVILTMSIGLVGCIVLFWKRVEIISIFLTAKDNVDVINQAIEFMQFMAISVPFMGVFGSLQGLFQGSGHTKYAMAMEIGRLWFIRIPIILIFKYFTNAGSIGIWFAMSSSNLLICIFGWYLYKRGNWLNTITR